MQFTPTKIAGAYLIGAQRIEDHRGYFARGWCEREFLEHGLAERMVQLNIGFSHRRGTIRGLHYQLAPHAEAKFVRCTQGAIFDVVVDLRPDSPTCAQWVAAELSAANGLMLYAPPGCAHGYQTLADDTEAYYLTSAVYAPTAARGVRYNDPAFGITWPLPVSTISTGDAEWPDFSR
jgi:dTDP-4-dehydrorhamnose 3,5-epimerase